MFYSKSWKNGSISNKPEQEACPGRGGKRKKDGLKSGSGFCVCPEHVSRAGDLL
jgi:hypothetical protein